MSLAERVSAMEEYENWSREPSPSGAGRRKLSFNPVDHWVPPTLRKQPVGAHEVSRPKRMLQVSLAVLYCLLAAGIVFGFAAIKPVLVDAHVYRNYCTKEELDENVRVCYQQELRLNLMFTIAAVSTNVAALPVGTILDRYGPRASGIIGALCIAVGSLFFAFAHESPFDGYIPGYLFLALGGPFIYISSFQLSNAFPQYSGLILALITGAFDTSSAVFLVYRLIFEASNHTFWPKKFFLAYLVVPVFLVVVQVLVMPAHSYKTVGELVTQAEDTLQTAQDDDALSIAEFPDDHDAAASFRDARRAHRESVVTEITELIGSKDAQQQTREEATKANVSGVWGALHGYTAFEQIKTWWFFLAALFTVVQMTRINYFVATIRAQYEVLFSSYDDAVAMNNFFDVALPLGGVIAIPFIGLILDNFSTTFCLSLLVTMATTIGILGVIPQKWAAYANIILFVVYRPLYYTTISDYAAKVFGFATFGKVYGLIICLAGLFNFSQAFLDFLTHQIFDHSPTPVNILLTGLTFIVGLSLVIFVWYQSRGIQRENLEEQAQSATEVLIPTAVHGIEGRDYGATN